MQIIFKKLPISRIWGQEGGLNSRVRGHVLMVRVTIFVPADGRALRRALVQRILVVVLELEDLRVEVVDLVHHLFTRFHRRGLG